MASRFLCIFFILNYFLIYLICRDSDSFSVSVSIHKNSRYTFLNTFLTLFLSLSSYTRIFLFLLYAWLAHLIISNPPRQFPNNVVYPFSMCLQSAIYLTVSLSVFSSSSLSVYICLPPCLHFLYCEEECLPVLCLVCLACIVSVRLTVFTHSI